jgi:hypothetical protein
MRVFVLCTGRSGSLTFIRACSHITNYTAGHETGSRKLGDARFSYPDNHIEADNRLSWFPGTLDTLYGGNAFYVHLVREKEATVRSFNQRWIRTGSLVRAYCEGILQIGIQKLDPRSRLEVANDLYTQLNRNIMLFLRDKTHRFTFHIEQTRKDFPLFWEMIGAEGDLEKALEVFGEVHNHTNTSRMRLMRHEIRFSMMRWRRRIF